MKNSILSFILVAFVALFSFIGCASRTDKIVSTELTIQRGTNTAHLISPKDVSFKSFSLDAAGRVELIDYRAVGNEAAIKSAEAQAAIYQSGWNRAIELGQSGAAIGGRVVGVPVPAPQPQQQTPQPVSMPPPAPAQSTNAEATKSARDAAIADIISKIKASLPPNP